MAKTNFADAVKALRGQIEEAKAAPMLSKAGAVVAVVESAADLLADMAAHLDGVGQGE
jgi:hypothetical protein